MNIVHWGAREDWRVNFAAYGGPFIVEPGNTTLNPENGNIIATISYCRGADGRDTNFKQTQSRAYMIAAAPSMLAVLQQFLAAVDAGALEMSSPDVGEPAICAPHPWHEEWLHYAREAVQRATPGASGGKKGGPTETEPNRPYCKPDQSCCDFTCGN